MSVLIGSTGFVGSHLARSHQFEVKVHRPNLHEILGISTDLLVCAGLPAEKWRANQQPLPDWANVKVLSQAISRVVATKAVLISTVDVYENPNGVTEEDPPNFDGAGAYGVHRAWFEAVFRYTFPEALIVRLPALFAADLKKNLVYDLLNHKQEQWRMVNPNSKFQYFDVSRTWEQIEKALDANLKLLNLSVEPVSAQEIANLFKVELSGESIAVHYDVRSVHSDDFGGRDGYLFDKSHALSGISKLQRGVSR